MSQVYYEYTEALKQYGYYSEVQSTRNEMICNNILHSWKLLKCDVHYLSYMLDIRFIKRTEHLPDHSVNNFLEVMEEIFDDDENHAMTIHIGK